MGRSKKGDVMKSPRRLGTVTLVILSILLLAGALHSTSAETADPSPAPPGSDRCNRASFRVIVDVGHTVQQYGTLSARGATEYRFNLRLANQIEQRLTDAGFAKTVELITAAPPRRGLFERVARANSLGADLFLSIHHDGVPDQFVERWEYDGRQRAYSDRFKGHSIFVSIDNGDYSGSLRFGHLLGDQLKARGLHYTPHYTQKFMGHRQRQLVDAEAGVYRYDQLVVLRHTRMPAVLLEAGSIVNRDEEVLLDSEERQALIASAATDAIEAFCAARSPRKPIRLPRRPGV